MDDPGARALQLLQPGTHAELLRRGAAAGLAANLGRDRQRKARMLLTALTVAADAGYAQGAADVSRALWEEVRAAPGGGVGGGGSFTHTHALLTQPTQTHTDVYRNYARLQLFFSFST